MRALLIAVAGLAAVAPGAGAVTASSVEGSGFAVYDHDIFTKGQGIPQGQASGGTFKFEEPSTGRELTIQISGKPGLPLTNDNPHVIDMPISVAEAKNADDDCKVGSEGRLTLNDKPPAFIALDLLDCDIVSKYGDGHGATVTVKFTRDPADKRPWFTRFQFGATVKGKGEPEDTKLSISHEMASRFFKGDDGVTRFPTTRSDVDPPEWRATLTASPCVDGPYHWTIERIGSRTSKGCEVKVRFAKLGKREVTVRAGRLHGKKKVRFKDRLVLGLGDSLASGEGVPDLPIADGRPRPVWQHRQCHRSGYSHQSIAARAIALERERDSVTFLHLACSGAAFDSGLFGTYEGIEPKVGPRLEGQMKRANEVMGDRKPDVVMLSIGVNHEKLGAVLKFCVANGDCRNRHVSYEGGADKFVEDPEGPTLADYVKERLSELPEKYALTAKLLDRLGVKRSRVYLIVYPDPTRQPDGVSYCPQLMPISTAAGLLYINGADTQWIADEFAAPLDKAVRKAAARHSWKLVDDYAEPFTHHAYCSFGDRWTVTYDDSQSLQGDSNGTIHPNYIGQGEIYKAMRKAVFDDLF